MTPKASTEAASQCRSAQEDGAGAEHRRALERAETAISEHRGVWTTVVLAGDDGFSALCVTDTSRHLFSDMFGSAGADIAGVSLHSRTHGVVVATGTTTLHL